MFVFACLCVSSFISDPLNGVQQTLFIIVGAELELGASVITELSDGHLTQTHSFDYNQIISVFLSTTFHFNNIYC